MDIICESIRFITVVICCVGLYLGRDESVATGYVRDHFSVITYGVKIRLPGYQGIPTYPDPRSKSPENHWSFRHFPFQVTFTNGSQNWFLWETMGKPWKTQQPCWWKLSNLETFRPIDGRLGVDMTNAWCFDHQNRATEGWGMVMEDQWDMNISSNFWVCPWKNRDIADRSSIIHLYIYT